MHPELQYLDILQELIDTPDVKTSPRQTIGTKYLFSRHMRFDNIGESFPLLTTKKMFFRGVVEELLWFLRGETDVTILQKKGVHIWDKNTSRESLNKLGLEHYLEYEGGSIYAHQWRNFGGPHYCVPPEASFEKGYDQLQQVIHLLKTNPSDRRIIINAWCPNQLEYMALPPCHVMYIFSVNTAKGELNCHLTQRSCDFLLGVGWNVSSLALLTMIIAKVSNLKPGSISWSGVDVHLYENHIDAANEQILRTPYPFPKVLLNKDISTVEDIEKLTFEDFQLINYTSHGAIKAEMVG